MTDPAETQHPTATGTPEDAPGSPSATIVPGVVLLVAGLWMVTDNGPLVIGWACFAIGLALLLVGVVASGVAWGLHLDAHRRRDRP